MTRRSSFLVSLGAALMFTVPAFGKANFVTQLPNAPANPNCNTCHSNGGGTPRNAFGQDVEASLVDGNTVDWSALWNVDSDGDGLSNGQELGDPCGQWSGGAAPRSDDLSEPGDEGSTNTAAADAGCGGGEMPPATFDARPSEGGDGDGDDDADGGADGGTGPGGCSCASFSSDSAFALFGLVAGALLVARRRPRRAHR